MCVGVSHTNISREDPLVEMVFQGKFGSGVMNGARIAYEQTYIYTHAPFPALFQDYSGASSGIIPFSKTGSLSWDK